MKKKLNEIFDEAKPEELDQFSDALDAPELSPEELASIKNKVYAKTNLRKKNSKSVWLRFGTTAACFVLIFCAVFVPMLREGVATPIPIVNKQMPSPEPKYYGDESSSKMPSGVEVSISGEGMSVIAEPIEILPDTYAFFDDWKQREYRLMRLKNIKILEGKEMTDEFYYLVPVKFMTDFSLYDRFVIKDMAQFTYEYSVMYNKTQGKAEQLNLVIFGYRTYGYDLMGENFIAFDSLGNFDFRLWKSNDAWIEATKDATKLYNIKQAEINIEQEEGSGKDFYVHLLKDITGDAEKVLAEIKSFENGIFIPTFSSSLLFASPEVQFRAVRYINGFATNESVRVWCREWTRGEEDTYAYTKARFNEDDMNRLPDLPAAFESVKEALNGGSATPPHFAYQENLRNTTSGIFGWYTKTENGVVGIIRVTWGFFTENYKSYYDDAYYIVEYGSDECIPIDRDDLLEYLGDYETTYIYTGKYDDHGKVHELAVPEM